MSHMGSFWGQGLLLSGSTTGIKFPPMLRTGPPVVRVRGLNHYFGEGESRKQVLSDNNLDLMPGEIAILTGPSGSGKTTLLTLIGALRSVHDGSLEVLGQELSGLSPRQLVETRRHVGFIFQAHNLFESLTAFQNVRMALAFKQYDERKVRKMGVDILTTLGLGHRIDYKPQAMSGGQKQRVAIARALVTRPKLVLADEPTAALDEKSGREVVRLFKKLAREDQTAILLVTHDSRILDSADRIINMVDGHIASDVGVAESVKICEFLARAPMFADLSAAILSEISEKMSVENFSPGAVIIRQGAEGDKFYLIREGSVDVVVDSGQGARTLGTLDQGDVFGETALLTGQPRNASVIARDNVRVYVLAKADFKAAVDSSPPLQEQLLKIFFQRRP